jgi:hypothetical protein
MSWRISASKTIHRRDVRKLKESPDWFSAAQTLVDGCVSLAHEEDRVSFFQSICTELGDELYPALLKILCVIGDHGDEPARMAIASCLVTALMTGRLPAGRLGAWGTNHTTLVKSGYGGSKSLGPVEYLCVWYAQASGRVPIAAPAFDRAARSLLTLVSTSEQARSLYSAKLLADAQDPMDGVLSRPTRLAIEQLAQSWQAGNSAQQTVNRFLASLQESTSNSGLRSLTGLKQMQTGNWQFHKPGT